MQQWSHGNGWYWATLVGVVVGACSGELTGDVPNADPSSQGSSGVAEPEALGSPPEGNPNACKAALGPMLLRRLTNLEYKNSLHDLLGGDVQADELPPDLTLHGFDNNAESIAISPTHLEGYRAVAERVSKDIVRDEARRLGFVGCTPSAADTSCLESFVRSFGMRTFRRPLTEAEVSDLLQFGAEGDPGEDSWGSVAIIIEALLQSPSFLFRPEVGSLEPGRPDLLRLTGFEVATRLSYLLWGTSPDDPLLASAAEGMLDTPQNVEAIAIQMLQDPRARRAAGEFGRQWLRLSRMDAVQRSSENFPAWNDELRRAMAEETQRVFENITKQAIPLMDMLDSRNTVVNGSLAELYGLPQPTAEWEPVTYPDSQGRAGILTHASILSLTSNTVGTTPILRGKYIREVLLCEELPAPPPEVPMLGDSRPGLSERERLAEHRINPACSGCHSLLEPLGFGLSNFDAIGAYRDVDNNGVPIDAQGTIEGLQGGAFQGAVELAQKLRQEPRVSDCLAKQYMRFSLGRGTSDSEKCTIQQLGSSLNEGGDFRTLVLQLVKSDVFRYRLASDHNKEGTP